MFIFLTVLESMLGTFGLYYIVRSTLILLDDNVRLRRATIKKIYYQLDMLIGFIIMIFAVLIELIRKINYIY